jgi:putative endonuclease
MTYIYYMQKSHIYIITNKNNTVLYIGVTSNLLKRVYQHKTKFYKGFTSKYNCDKLVYFEEFNDIKSAIAREKQLKAGSRKRKEELINATNPEWNDLSDGWVFSFD